MTRHAGVFNDNTLIRHMADGWECRQGYHPIKMTRTETGMWLIALFASSFILSASFLGFIFDEPSRMDSFVGILAIICWFATAQVLRKKRAEDLKLQLFIENYTLAKLLLGVSDNEEVNMRSLKSKADALLCGLAKVSFENYEGSYKEKQIGIILEHSLDCAYVIFFKFHLVQRHLHEYKKQALECLVEKDG